MAVPLQRIIPNEMIVMSSRRPTICLIKTVLGLVASLMSAGVMALEWSAEPSVSVQEIYNDNIRLMTEAHDSVTGTILIPKLQLAVRSEIWDISSSAQIRDSNYSGIEGLDAKDNIYNLSSSYRTMQSQWQLSGTSTKESLLTSEPNPDTGLVGNQTQRETKSGVLSYTYLFTDTTRVSASYQNTDVIYEQGLARGLFDYQQDQISLTVSEQYTERTQVFVTGGYSKSEVPANRLTSENTTAKLGIIFSFDETTKLTLSGGTRKTSSQGVVKQCILPVGQFCLQYGDIEVNSVDRGSVYDTALEKQFEAGNLRLGYNRDVSTSGSGVQVETNALSLALQRSLNVRNSLFFNTSAYRIQSLETALSNTDRRYYQAEPGWRWRCAETCSMELSYRYSYLKYLNTSASAKSNALTLSLSYAWPKLYISR